MTLRELREKIGSTDGVATPGEEELRKGNSLTGDVKIGSGWLNVYENGFASYTDGSRSTVLRADSSGDYVYRFAEGETRIPSDALLDMPCETYLTMLGEDRLEMNRASSSRHNNDSVISDDVEYRGFYDCEEAACMKIALETAYRSMNEKERLIYRLYVLSGYSQREISDMTGIKARTVSRIVCSMKKKITG